jgi:hypothetical protein
VDAVLFKRQNDGTNQDKSTAEPVMQGQVFAKNNRSQNNCEQDTKFIHRRTRDASPSCRDLSPHRTTLERAIFALRWFRNTSAIG